MRQRTMKMLDTYSFVGVIVAIVMFLWWIFAKVI